MFSIRKMCDGDMLGIAKQWLMKQIAQVKIFADRTPETVKTKAKHFLSTIPPSQISEILQETKADDKTLTLIYTVKVKYIRYIN